MRPLSRLTVWTAIAALFLPALARAAGSDVFSRSIAGKEWRVEPIEGSPNYRVTWGEQEVVWEPKGWQPEELRETGPSYYWKRFGEATPYPPLDMTMDERAKLDGQEAFRGFVLLEDTSQFLDWKGGFCFDIISSGGGVRTRCAIEWKRAYERDANREMAKASDPPLLNKRTIILVAPRSARGTGFVSYIYDSPVKEQDNWLYLPSVRKIRRLATASKDDYFAGMPLRNEDLPQVSPYNHNYELKRIELFEDPGPEHWGFGDSGWEKKEERIEGIGAPCWVVEVTPKETPYWFAKKILRINMFTFGIVQELVYDEDGEIVRESWFSHRPANLIDPDVPPSYLIFDSWGSWDRLSGYKSVVWGAHRRENVPWEESFFDTEFSEEIFNPDKLVEEYTSTEEFGPTPQDWVGSGTPWPHPEDVATSP